MHSVAATRPSQAGSAECQISRLVETGLSAHCVGPLELGLADDLAKPCLVVVPQPLLQRGLVRFLVDNFVDASLHGVVGTGQLSAQEVIAHSGCTAGEFEDGGPGAPAAADPAALGQRYTIKHARTSS
jgi:hypothetical protein